MKRPLVLPLLSALILCGCFDIERPAVYPCSTQHPGCPPGHVCSGTQCVSAGADHPALDGRPVDQARPDSARSDKAKGDLAKPDKAKGDLAKPDAAGLDAGKLDKTKADLGKPDAPKPDMAKPDMAKPDSGKPDQTKADLGPVCTIGGTTYQNSQVNPGDPCQFCDLNQSKTSWTFRSGVYTAAGSGTQGFLDGAADKALFKDVSGLAVDASGTVYIADQNNNRIRKLSGGMVSTLAGTGQMGHKDGDASAAHFNYPRDVAVDASGVVWVADAQNYRVRKIVAGSPTWVSTVAGTGYYGNADAAALSATFSYLTGIALDSSGTIYVADSDNARFRQIKNGQVSHLAGDTNGTAGYANGTLLTSKFNYPLRLVVMPSNDLYVVDQDTQSQIRYISGSAVSTFAGSTSGYADGAYTSAKFNAPAAIARDPSATLRLYVADAGNYRIRILESGQVKTIAGSGTQGLSDGTLISATFKSLHAIAVDSKGNLFVGDGAAIRRICLNP